MAVRKTRSKETATESNAVNRLASANGREERISIQPLRQAIMTVPIIGIAPLKILRFSSKKQGQVMATQAAGEQAKTKRNRAPKEFEREYEEAKYRCTVREEDGREITWLGLNAAGVRKGCVETCRVASYVMTRMKLIIRCLPDGRDDLDQTDLVRIHGEPEMTVDPVRNARGGIDLRPRVMFREWKASPRLWFDEDHISPSDIINLMIRVGQQNGLGEGRPNGTNGCGTGCGLFIVDVDHCILERLPSTPAIFQSKE